MRTIIIFGVFLPGCVGANFAMNVADRIDISNIFHAAYCEHIAALQIENDVRRDRDELPMPIPRFSQWMDGFRARAAYGQYIDAALAAPDLNPAPPSFAQWSTLAPGDRPRARAPEPPPRRIGDAVGAGKGPGGR